MSPSLTDLSSSAKSDCSVLNDSMPKNNKKTLHWESKETLEPNFGSHLHETFVSLKVTPQIHLHLILSWKYCSIFSSIMATADGSGKWKEKTKCPKTLKRVLFCKDFSLHYNSKLILQHLPKRSCSNNLPQILLWIIYCNPYQRAKQKSQLFLV